MGEVAVTIVKWLAKIGPIVGAVTAFVIVLNIATSFILVGYNMGAFSDVYAMVSMWLPFNLNVLMLWVVTASSAYMIYRLMWVGVSWLNRLLG